MAGSARRAAFSLVGIFCLAPFALAEGCSDAAKSSSATQPPDQSTVPRVLSDTIHCGYFDAMTPSRKTEKVPEYYILSSINRKLDYYPEFAKAIGTTSVSTCEEARAFVVAYNGYFAAHPYFDKDLPSDPRVLVPPTTLAPETAPGVTTVPKIFNGLPTGPTTSSRFPVVEISYQLPAGQQSTGGSLCDSSEPCTERCSGTFISKNFILTAAHCFQKLAYMYPPGKAPQWETAGYHDNESGTDISWTVSWPDQNGAVAPAGGAGTWTGKAWTIVHPDYIGLTAVTMSGNVQIWTTPLGSPGGTGYDIGLLWITPDNDWQLAANAQDSSMAVQLQMVDSLLSNWQLTDYGYGPTTQPADFTMPPPPVLTSRAIELPPNNPVGGNGVGSALTEPVGNLGNGNYGSLCKGDSGGPLVRLALTSGPTPEPVIVGVNSEYYPSTVNGDDTYCAFDSSQTIQWSRTDVAIPFLTQMVQAWNGSLTFSPPVQPEGSQPNSYVEFWGSPCRGNCNCTAAGTRCANSPTDPNSAHTSACPACGDGTCNCMIGQCLPLSNNSDVGDASIACTQTL